MWGLFKVALAGVYLVVTAALFWLPPLLRCSVRIGKRTWIDLIDAHIVLSQFSRQKFIQAGIPRRKYSSNRILRHRHRFLNAKITDMPFISDGWAKKRAWNFIGSMAVKSNCRLKLSGMDAERGNGKNNAQSEYQKCGVFRPLLFRKMPGIYADSKIAPCPFAVLWKFPAGDCRSILLRSTGCGQPFRKFGGNCWRRQDRNSFWTPGHCLFHSKDRLGYDTWKRIKCDGCQCPAYLWGTLYSRTKYQHWWDIKRDSLSKKESRKIFCSRKIDSFYEFYRVAV